jgi:hypothetical protein
MLKKFLEKLKSLKAPKLPPVLIRSLFYAALLLIFGGGGTGVILFSVYKPQIELLNDKDPDRYKKMTKAVKNLKLKKAYKLYRELDALSKEQVYELRYAKWKDRWEKDKEFRDQSLKSRFEENKALSEVREERYANRIAKVEHEETGQAAIRETWKKASTWDRGLLLRYACVHYLHEERMDMKKRSNVEQPALRQPIRIHDGVVSGMSESARCEEWVEVSHDPESLKRSLQHLSAGMNYYYYSRLLEAVGLSSEQVFSAEDRATKMAGDFERF